MKEDVIFLQFGEAANSSLINLWNIRAQREGIKEVPKTLIYSERVGLKGIISQGQIQEDMAVLDDPESKDALINQRTGRWTDFNYGYDFPESSYRELSEFDASVPFLSAFYDSKSTVLFKDVFEEDVRRLAEKCDRIEGFNFVSESCCSIGASNLHALEHLNDEYNKAPKIVFTFAERIKIDSVDSAVWDNRFDFDGGKVGEALKLALTFSSIEDQHVSFVPLAEFSRSSMKMFDKEFNQARSACNHIFSSLFFDLFNNQNMPAKGRFASLFTQTTHHLYNLTFDHFSDAKSSNLRRIPSAFDPESSHELMAYLKFDHQPFCKRAEAAISFIQQPRSVSRALESANVVDELAAGDYHQELLETLHRLKDLGSEID